MKISQIQPNYTSFKARNDYITKKMLEPAAKIISEADAPIKKDFAHLKENFSIEAILKANGITYCNAKGGTVHASAGYNGGFYSLKLSNPYIEESPDALKLLFADALANDNFMRLGGFLNYKKMVGLLKRQDIILKGLQQHTYELNTNVKPETAETVADYISTFSNKFVRPRDLFFINNDAYYYDYLDKTVHSVSTTVQEYSIKPTYRVCKFFTDDKGNATGFSLTAQDLFLDQPTETIYKEQMKISDTLPSVADSVNNKLFAEAFRFGNTTKYNVRLQSGIDTVLNHLRTRVKVTNPTEEDLQVIKYYDNDKNIVSRICYYDPTTGRSLVYNENGKYLHQIEYIKDDFGNITSCMKVLY